MLVGIVVVGTGIEAGMLDMLESDVWGAVFLRDWSGVWAEMLLGYVILAGSEYQVGMFGRVLVGFPLSEKLLGLLHDLGVLVWNLVVVVLGFEIVAEILMELVVAIYSEACTGGLVQNLLESRVLVAQFVGAGSGIWTWVLVWVAVVLGFGIEVGMLGQNVDEVHSEVWAGMLLLWK